MKKLLFILLIINLLACRPDTDVFIPHPVTPDETVTTSIGGSVIDENQVPVIGALVQLGTETKETDQNGVFIFRDVEVNAERAYLKVDKAGFFQGSRAIQPQEDRTSIIRVQLLLLEEIGTIAAAAGGDIELPSGAVITFPENSVQRSNGNAYDGDIIVAAKYLNPADKKMVWQMPGDLLGIDANERTRALASFGMLAVEISGENGAPIRLVADKMATIRVPVPSDLIAGAPNTIPLWHFDKLEGFWKEEGTAILEEGSYVGEVEHFSFWNCDAPFDVVQLTGKVVDPQGEPLPAVQLDVNYLASTSVRSGWTNHEGTFQGQVPANQQLGIQVLDICGNSRVSQSIDPLSSDVNLGEFILTDEDNLRTISGILLDCNNQVVGNGYVKVSTGQSYNIYYVAEDGSFNASFVSCSENETVDVIGVNMTDTKQSQVFQYVVGNTIDAGNLLACNELEEYISFNLDGTDYLMLEPFGQKEQSTDQTRLGAEWDGNFIILNQIQGANLGNFNLESLSVNDLTSREGEIPNVTVTFNAYGTVEELITGTFEGDFVDNDGGSHVIKGSFRIQRDN